jgi:hypothetical protein
MWCLWSAGSQSGQVEGRQKKREGADLKAREAREEAESLQRSVEQSKASRDTRMIQIQQMLADQQQENEEMGRISESEVRRRQQAAARAEKRAQVPSRKPHGPKHVAQTNLISHDTSRMPISGSPYRQVW